MLVRKVQFLDDFLRVACLLWAHEAGNRDQRGGKERTIGTLLDGFHRVYSPSRGVPFVSCPSGGRPALAEVRP
jgi:hypothetical protein